MRWDDLLVGGLAIGIAAVATASAVGVIASPYRLRSVRSIQQRFGETAARVFFLLLAALMLCSGAAILSGLRPSYGAIQRPVHDPPQ